MCVTWCHRRAVLYWNHVDCDGHICPLAGESHLPCAACRHQSEPHCGLTRAPLPADGAGCCHHNVDLAEGWQEVDREMLAPLGIRVDETEEYVLKREGVLYQRRPRGGIQVDVDTLGLPYIYGRGTDHLPDEPFDWSGWFDQWQQCEEET